MSSEQIKNTTVTRDDHDHGHRDDVIVAHDRSVEQPSHAGIGKDSFDDGGATDHARHRDRDNSDHRDQRIFQSMSSDDNDFAQVP